MKTGILLLFYLALWPQTDQAQTPEVRTRMRTTRPITSSPQALPTRRERSRFDPQRRSSTRLQPDSVGVVGLVVKGTTPMPGVAVNVKNHRTGTTTDTNGQFRLRLLGGDTLRIAYGRWGTTDIPIPANLPTVRIRCDIATGSYRILRETAAIELPTTLSFHLPAFNLPPPVPSVKQELERSLFPNVSTLAGVNTRIKNALQRATYPQYSYYRLQNTEQNAGVNGFALVAQVEQIERDGKPLAGRDRWLSEVRPWKEGSFTDYLLSLFRTNRGYFRVIVFVVSDQTFGTDASASPTAALSWLEKGAASLPDEIGSLPFGPAYRCVALIYEFEKRESSTTARQVTPSTTSAQEHLDKAGIWKFLNP